MKNLHRLLIAVDNTPTSMNAVDSVGQLFQNNSAIEITLAHIYPEPPPDYYKQGHCLAEYQSSKRLEAQKMFEQFKAKLSSYHLPETSIKTICEMASGKTISQAILDVQSTGEFGMIVVGRRGVSKAEEFLFGSISNSLVRGSSGCAVLVIG